MFRDDSFARKSPGNMRQLGKKVIEVKVPQPILIKAKKHPRVDMAIVTRLMDYIELSLAKRLDQI